jgi:YVTN family beta-propeller protein
LHDAPLRRSPSSPPPWLPAEQGSPAIKHISTGSGPEALDLSPDGLELWVANHNEGTITIIDAATDAVKDTIDKIGEFPIRLKFTPDGRRVLGRRAGQPKEGDAALSFGPSMQVGPLVCSDPARRGIRVHGCGLARAANRRALGRGSVGWRSTRRTPRCH